MREHEVPTHVQAEDRVLLWFTFPQIVAMTAVCALSYGAYRYAPIGPTEVRIVLTVVMGLVGTAMVVGTVGGRRLPLVAADLLRFWLGPRRYAGTPAHLVRSEPPPPVQKSTLGPLQLAIRKTRAGLRKLRRRRKRHTGRAPFRPHGWFGKRRHRRGGEHSPAGHKRSWRVALVATPVAALALIVPGVALADGHWQDELEFEPPEPIPGRRIYVEGLEVSGERAQVTLRAATDLHLWVRAYGGPDGTTQVMKGVARLDEGEHKSYELPIEGGAPSFTFSWKDSLEQAGAFTLKEKQLPYPLPSADGELCDLEITSWGWTPGSITGTVETRCVDTLQEVVDLTTVMGHHQETLTALMEASVTRVIGWLGVTTGGLQVRTALNPNGETAFQLPIPTERVVHDLRVEARLDADLDIPIPPVVSLTHHPAWTEPYTETVTLTRPGVSRTVSERVTVTNDDGTTSQHTISATLSVPSRTVYRDVTVYVDHPEHVRAEVLDRTSLARSRSERVDTGLSIQADSPYEVFVPPPLPPDPVLGEQTPLTTEEARELFERMGWEWPW